MNKTETTRVSVADVARAAGVSRTTVSYVLNNHPGPSAETREQVLRTARELNYIPDARLISFMERVREAKDKELLPLLWLNAQPDGENVWHEYKWLSPYWEGAYERAEQLGYRLEEAWTLKPGRDIKQIARMIYLRGIEGVILAFPSGNAALDWKQIAGVALENTLPVPRLDRVMSDALFNLSLAVQSVREMGYRRIGICLAEHMDVMSEHRYGLVVQYLYTTAQPRERVHPLIHSPASNEHEKEEQFVYWLRQEKPEVVIGCHNAMVSWAQRAGYRVPDDLGIVHLSLDDDVLDWAGIYSNRRILGKVAVEQLVSLIRNRQFGLPETPHQIYVRGEWRMGSTLRAIKAPPVAVAA